MDETPLIFEKVIKGCYTSLGDRPDVQFHVKELAGKRLCPIKGAMKTLENVIDYLAGTMNFYVKMTRRNPAQSFRYRTEGVTIPPFYEADPICWLLEVATDLDWSGNKLLRRSTSCGFVFWENLNLFSFEDLA